MDRSLLICFAYAPAGLGHLRVTDALYHGLPKGTNTPLLLGSQDKTITYLHRFMSLNPFVRNLTTWAEKGFLENLTTFIYKYLLRSHTDLLYEQMKTIVSESYALPSKILIIATHFGLAHQLSAIKERLEKDTRIKVILVVQVTDDSPHHIWYIPGADLIFVPSEKTQRELSQYGKKINSVVVPITVNPYPISPILSKPLTEGQYKEKLVQVDNRNPTLPIQVIIPISGAAVGTDYFTILTAELNKRSSRFLFHIICKDAPFTKKFISEIAVHEYIRIYGAQEDRKVINIYEDVYQKNIISIEITKPSEQSFKALLDCKAKNAPLLLFTEPIGRQEYDNLDFLKRHKLIPNNQDQEILMQMKISPEILAKASSWRGIRLIRDPVKAAQFIYWCLESEIFSKMMRYKPVFTNDHLHQNELAPDGVKKFWEKVADLL
ncbi:conserved hypothetical protein [Candidatus Roizmanbacteria bacterium]|nr:conserved hypothetical protein [Candidatus Roizmanbacteria bacterium]